MSNPNFPSSTTNGVTADAAPLMEKNRLRNDAAYVGGLSIALTLVMQYAYSFFVKVLMSFGVLNSESLTKDFLGMDNTVFLLFYSFVYIFSLLVPAVVVSFLSNKRFVQFSPAKCELAEITRGPVIPKWVNIISPKSSNRSFPFPLFNRREMFRKDNPDKPETKVSLVSRGTKLPTRGVTVCPNCFANRYPSPVEPVTG